MLCTVDDHEGIAVIDLTRLTRRAIDYPRYAYYFLLERMNRGWSIERPRFKALGNGSASVSDRSDSIEFYLFKEQNPINEFEQPTDARARVVSNIKDKFRTEACFMCGSRLAPLVQVVNFNEESDYIEYSWCSGCDHSQYSVLPSKEWISNWYLTNWDTSKTLDENLVVRRPTYRYYNRLKKYLGTTPLKVLDIGAGYGEKIVPFKEHGHQLFCTEATPRRAEYLRQHVTPNVFLGSFDDPQVQDNLIRHAPYDLIFSYHVVEHIYNPCQELQLLRDIAAEGAIFYLAIPEFYKEGILNNIYQMEHVESFSRNSGKQLLKQLGFDTVRADDDLFQYYSDYCQYFVGKKATGSNAAVIESGFPASKVSGYLREALQLDRIREMAGNAFTYTYFNHTPLRYLVSEETKRKCAKIEDHLPIKIYHKDLPLFWMVS